MHYLAIDILSLNASEVAELAFLGVAESNPKSFCTSALHLYPKDDIFPFDIKTTSFNRNLPPWIGQEHLICRLHAFCSSLGRALFLHNVSQDDLRAVH